MAHSVGLCWCGGRRGDGRAVREHFPAFRESQGRRGRRGGDIAGLKAGEKITVEWRGKPVWIIKRTPEQLAALPGLDPQLADPRSERKPSELTPEYARNENRSIKPEILVAVGICTHLGCSPSDKFTPGAQPSLPDDWKGGFLCPCHGSTFDMAGRVFKNKPAPDNLEVPPHMYLSETRLLIGEDKKA